VTAAPNDTAADQAGPVLQVLGNASAEEIAVLTAILAGLGGGEPQEAPRPSRWTDRARLVRQPVHPGPGGWWASGLPR